MAGGSSSSCRIVCLATLVVVMAGILFSGEKSVVMAQGGCKGDLQGLLKECMKYVSKPGPQIDPSPSCCAIVKDTDIKCVCGIIPFPIVQTISSAKVAHVAQFCGNPLPPGVKCGS
ncbi:uncharacterized protein LOC122086329 isoform X2 [Macadamia integrifolia]|uniref:uncharacterized protein LOC122086329 isoform X2 n=1 Tax=Macadamia integrifolia TaxID=60698 RepID=UPI001C4E6489|nr:uncharacterized protein LOC122086329 isoform X2 [Macadamia integrifolia]